MHVSRRLARLAALPVVTAVAVGLLAPAGAGATPKQGNVTLRLGYFPNVTHASAIVGVEGGIFQDKLGSNVKLIAPDGFSDFRNLVQYAGLAAEGMFVTFPALPVDRLPAAGRQFAASFGAATGGEVEPFAVTAAQAADVMLAAIAASDGTRDSVTRQLMAIRVRNGILGSFGFDQHGDKTSPTISVYKVVGGKPATYATLSPPVSLAESP